MTAIVAWFAVEAHRAYLYRTALAGLALLVVFGVITGAQATELGKELAGVLIVGLAAKNTDTGAKP